MRDNGVFVIFLDTQRKAGLPMVLPYDSANIKQLTPQMSRRQPPKPLFQSINPDFSDTEVSDQSPDEDKTATVERKMPAKEELDRAVCNRFGHLWFLWLHV